MLSFLAMVWDVKLLVFLLCSFILALAMHHIELTKAEPLAFFVHMRMHARIKKTKQNRTTFLPCIDFHHLPPTAQHAWEIHFHSRKTSCGVLLGDENEGWGEGDTHMGQLSWWSESERGLANGGTECWWVVGSQSVIWLWSMWSRLSFPSWLRTLRVRYKITMPLIPAMPTCLKPSHLLPKAGTQLCNQSDVLDCSCSHRRTCLPWALHLTALPSCIFFPSLISYCFIRALCISWMR